jgi:acyl-CoA thioester hydrolase
MPPIFVRSFNVPTEAIDEIGHANNIEYVRWMQEIATEHSAAQGWPLERYVAGGAGWLVRSHTIDYLRPAFAADAIALFTWVADFGRSTSRRKYLFYRARDDEILVRAETLWVFVNFRSGAPARITEPLRSAFDVVADEGEALRLARAVGVTS